MIYPACKLGPRQHGWFVLRVYTSYKLPHEFGKRLHRLPQRHSASLAAAASAAMPVISNSELILRKMQEAEDVKEAEARQWEASAAERAHKTKMAEQWASMLKVQSGQQCPSSASLPPQGMRGGYGRLATASGARAHRLQSRRFRGL